MATLIGNIIGLVILMAVVVWVFLDAKAIGSDRGRSPGLVNTQPGAWAVGVILMLIVVLPLYLLARVRYRRLLAQRRQAEPLAVGSVVETPGTWPPPPNRPAP